MIQRPFASKDLVQILEFKRKSAEVSFGRKEINIEPFKKKLLSEWKKNPDSMIVLEDKGLIVGYIWVVIRKGILGKFGKIEHTFIHENYRRRGLATRLKKSAEKYLTGKGIKRVVSTVSLSNKPMIKLNENLGYVKKRVIMEKKI